MVRRVISTILLGAMLAAPVSAGAQPVLDGNSSACDISTALLGHPGAGCAAGAPAGPAKPGSSGTGALGPLRGIRPQSAPAAAPPEGRKLAATFHIQFELGSANLTADSRSTLDRVAEVLATAGKVRFRIEGHTDSTGTPERNLDLSRRRAAAVMEYLVERGVPARSLEAVGRGQQEPIDPANPRAPENRRVVIENLGPG